MASSMLRPLALGEILDAGIKVVSRNWKPLVTTLLLVTTPVQILVVLVLASLGPDTTFQIIPDTSKPAQDPSADFLVGLGLSLLLTGVAVMLAFTALFKAVCDAWLGAQPTVKRSLAYGARRAPMVFVLFWCWLIPMCVFALPCGIPALWLGTVWSLSIPAMLFERLGPFKALGRSFGLISGRFWECLLIVLVVGLLTEVLAGLIQLPILTLTDAVSDSNEIANAVATVIASMISASITYPYMAAVLTILYFDQRVRKEGFDIQLLADGMGVEYDPDAPLPIPPAHQGWGPPPQPGWGPPPPTWEPPGPWAPPSAGNQPPPEWRPSAPADDRPAEESPWMTPSPERPRDDS